MAQLEKERTQAHGEKLLYTAKVHTTGGRDHGPARSFDGHLVRARLKVSLPGVKRDVAQTLVDEAHRICPYSKATRGNVDVAINLV